MMLAKTGTVRRLAIEFVAMLAFLAAYQLNSGVSEAQTSRRFSKGDEVLVPFLREMRPAVVIETDSRRVLAEFEFAGTTKQQAFPKNQVIYAFEAGALAPARNWSDASGQFKVLAAVLSVVDGKVKLRKSDNLVLDVPLDKLCAADQSFLKRLIKDAGPAAAGRPTLPPIETFEKGDQFGSLSLGFRSDGARRRPAAELRLRVAGRRLLSPR